MVPAIGLEFKDDYSRTLSYDEAIFETTRPGLAKSRRA